MATHPSQGFADERRRPGVAIGVVALHLGLGALLLSGLSVGMPARLAETLTVISLKAPPKQAEPPRPSSASPVKRTHEDAPKARRADPSEIVVPKVAVPQPSQVVAAPVPGTGAAASAGASNDPGPGAGAGGEGLGGGRGGEGAGDGPPFIPSKRIAGKIKDSDYPPGLREAGIGGTAHVSFVVGIDGRVSDCRITESSGSDELDQLTCRLITERFRYRPARNEDGTPVPDHWFGENEWVPR